MLMIRIVKLGPSFTACTCPAKFCEHCNQLPYCPMLIDYPVAD